MSVTNRCYSATITVYDEGGMLDTSCDCPGSSWLCSHITATAVYASKKGLSKSTCQIP